jgi:hypothetical protein
MWWDDVWPFKVETPDEPTPVPKAAPVIDRPPTLTPTRARARPVAAAAVVPASSGVTATPPRSDRRRRGWIAAAAVAAACVVAVSATWLVSDGQPDDQAVLTRAGAFEPPDPLPPDTSFVRTRVLPSGDLDVRHWIHTASWVYSVTLATPVVAGLTPGSVRVTRLFFASDGTPAPVVVPSGSPHQPRTFQLPPTRRLYVRYRLSGVVQRSDGSGPRALARITSLNVATSSALVRTTRSVVGATVLTLACTRDAATAPTPCGTERGGVWSARLGPGDSDTPVMAQLDLP